MRPEPRSDAKGGCRIEPLPLISFADFVACDTTQERLHELVAGRVVPFLAGSANHELITGNVFAKLHATVNPPCLVFPSTTVVQTVSRSGENGYRPDVTVSCAKANIGTREFIEDPIVVVEIVSPSTSGPDWLAKVFEYWNTPAILQLVFIESRERFVTSNLRDAAGMWLPLEITQGDGHITFAPVSVTMSLENIYANSSIARGR